MPFAVVEFFVIIIHFYDYIIVSQQFHDHFSFFQENLKARTRNNNMVASTILDYFYNSKSQCITFTSPGLLNLW